MNLQIYLEPVPIITGLASHRIAFHNWLDFHKSSSLGWKAILLDAGLLTKPEKFYNVDQNPDKSGMWSLVFLLVRWIADHDSAIWWPDGKANIWMDSWLVDWSGCWPNG